ncbi:nuclear transport factor 2 family protein [Kiloniella sp. b19]|uniref:nuclear transport factor 2 family protein n=1 Tax=Kiloniella sp. GXU_MW_B19 TaxID=3141326 RepID=UPI0031E0C652
MAESKKIAHAKGLYLEGIRDGNAQEALDKHTGARYTQHSTGVGDGKEGFIKFFRLFLERNPVRDIQIIRAIEDGSNVFLHVYQNLNDGEAQWVTADLFDTDDQGRMIEHWDVIAPYESANPAGRTMIDGPTEVQDLDKTDANKAHIETFMQEVLVGRRFERVPEFISTETYLQHTPNMKDGIQGLVEHVEEFKKQGIEPKYHKVHKIIGQGNFGVGFSHVQRGQSHFAVFDIFRVEKGKIVEHWDVEEKILAPEEWNNSGKF